MESKQEMHTKCGGEPLGNNEKMDGWMDGLQETDCEDKQEQLPQGHFQW